MSSSPKKQRCTMCRKFVPAKMLGRTEVPLCSIKCIKSHKSKIEYHKTSSPAEFLDYLRDHYTKNPQLTALEDAKKRRTFEERDAFLAQKEYAIAQGSELGWYQQAQLSVYEGVIAMVEHDPENADMKDDTIESLNVWKAASASIAHGYKLFIDHGDEEACLHPGFLTLIPKCLHRNLEVIYEGLTD